MEALPPLDGEMNCVNGIQLREVPKEMRTRLPAYYVAALESRSVPPGDRLHNVVLELIISFKQRFDFGFPALNAPLLMFKHVRELCLPRESQFQSNLKESR
jgi:RNA polymerase I-specific transcription initiation factor RRN7